MTLMEKDKYIKPEYPESEFTSKLIRFVYDIYDELSYGLPERIYQKAFESLLNENNIGYSREKYGKIVFNNEIIGKYYIDFVIENKIAVEFKVRNEIYQKDINQLLNYLKSENLKLGLVIALTKDGPILKRVAN